MKITKAQLKQIIKEELGSTLQEFGPPARHAWSDMHDAIAAAAHQRAKDIGVHKYFTEYPNSYIDPNHRTMQGVAKDILQNWRMGYNQVSFREREEGESPTTEYFVQGVKDGAADQLVEKWFKEYAETTDFVQNLYWRDKESKQ
tara:strand:+ start:384 stop:815 length:432 start_codon:yes stop_codon:yes gene_type:complete